MARRVSVSPDPGSSAAGPRPPTLHDVARLAGVSAQTVSRVVNNHRLVHSDTRTSVLQAMAQLRYRPNRAAQALATRHSRLIGLLVVQDDQRSDTADAIRAVDGAAQRRGYAVVNRHVSTNASALTARQVDLLVDQGVEGVVVLFPDERILQTLTMNSLQVPVVCLESVNGQSGSSHAPHITPGPPYDIGAEYAVEQILPILPSSRK